MQPTDIVEHGFQNFCPFCAALKWSNPAIGSRILVLSGHRCGDRGEIVELDQDPDVLICQFDGEPSEWTYRENRRHELITLEKIYFVPDWAPPISVEDAGILHSAMVYGFAEALQNGEPLPQRAMLQDFIVATWRQRLPLAPTDVWPMLLAHGFAAEARTSVCDHFAFGLEVLGSAVGRGAIQRKRMAPFQSFRYQPKRRRS